MIDWTQVNPFNYSTMSIMSLLVFLIILITLLFLKFKHQTVLTDALLYPFIKLFMSIFTFTKKLFDPVLGILNIYPFQSLLLQFFCCYLVFFSIMITHPLPFLARWSTITNTILYSFLLFFLVAIFIQFVVPSDGSKEGFDPNYTHFKQNIGIYLGLLASIFIIILLAIGISYLAANHTNASWFAMVISMIILAMVVLHMVWTFIGKFTPINLPSLSKILSYFISIKALQRFSSYIINNLKNTSPEMYILLAVEISFLLAYFVIPLLGNLIYLKSPGNKDYDGLLNIKIKGMQSHINSMKEIMKDLQGGIDIDWTNAAKLDTNSLRVKLYDAGYTEATEPAAFVYVRQNQNQAAELYKDIRDSEDKLKELKDEWKTDKDYATKQILSNPIYTDNITQLGSFENMKTGGDYNYKYTVSAWFFVHNQPPNHSAAYNRFTSLLNYGNKPNILYNAKDGILQVRMKTGTADEIVYETKNFPLQTWNNVVINYDQGTLDIFINGELVETVPTIIPDMKFANIYAGEDDGISGGICNVVYYSGNLSRDRIVFFYNLLKKQKYPVFPSTIDNYINTPLKEIRGVYDRHPYISILGVIGSIAVSLRVLRGFKEHQ